MTETMITKVCIERSANQLDYFLNCKLETILDAETDRIISQEVTDSNLCVWMGKGFQCIWNESPTVPQLRWFQSELDGIDIRDMEYINDKEFKS